MQISSLTKNLVIIHNSITAAQLVLLHPFLILVVANVQIHIAVYCQNTSVSGLTSDLDFSCHEIENKNNIIPMGVLEI